MEKAEVAPVKLENRKEGQSNTHKNPWQLHERRNTASGGDVVFINDKRSVLIRHQQ